MKGKQQRLEHILLIGVAALMAIFAMRFEQHEYRYQKYETSSVKYVKAQVKRIIEQELTVSGADGEYMTGYQKLCIRILEGDEKGEEKEIENYITVQHHVIPREGSRVIICADCPENAEAYYSLYNYDRSYGLLIVVMIFVLLVILIGRKQGAKSCIALLFTMVMVVCYLIPQLYDGGQTIWATFITVALSCTVTCLCIGGITLKTRLNIVSAVLGGISAGAVYALFSGILSITGCTMEDAESLVLIAQSTGLNLEGVLFAAVTISSLGAVMDVAVSLGASLEEISSLNPEMGRKELFQSGMNIGKDMMGTMTNTLILAFAGGSLSTLLVLISYGVQFHQFVSSNFLALEAAKGLAGSAAVVLTVPISAAVCAVGYGKKKQKQYGGK